MPNGVSVLASLDAPPSCVQWMPLSGRGNGGRVVTLTARPLFSALLPQPRVLERRSDLMLTKNMARSSARKRKKRGRPRTGVRPMIGARLSDETQAGIQRWAKSQHDKPTFSEAVRRLIDMALKSLNELE